MQYELKNYKKIVLEAIIYNRLYYGYSLHVASDELKNDKEIALQAVKQNINALKCISEKLINDTLFLIDCFLINNNFINSKYNTNKKLIELVKNLQYNFNSIKPIIDNYFFENLKYIYKISNFLQVLEFLLINYKKLVIKNYKYFIDIIDFKLEYIQLFQDYDIYFFNKQETTSFGELDFQEIKTIYENKYKNKIILWY